jgi:hypothetical protein
MPINSNIPLSVFANAPDLGEIAGRWEAIKRSRTRGKVEDLQLSELQRQMDETAAVRHAAAGAVTPQQTNQVNMPGPTLASYAAPHSVSDGSNGPQPTFSLPTNPIQLPGSQDALTSPPQFDRSKMLSNLAANPQTAAQVPAFQSQFAQEDAQLAQHLQAIKSGQAKLSKEQADALTAHMGVAAQLALPIKQLEDSNASPDQINGVYQQQLAKAQQSGIDVSSLPPQYVPGIGNHIVQQGMAVKDALGAQHAEATAAETARHNQATEAPKPGVDVTFSPEVAAQKVQIAQASRPVAVPLPGGSSGPSIDQIPKIMQNSVRGLANYEVDPATFPSRVMRGSNQIDRATAVGMAKEIDPTYDETQFKSRSALRKDANSGQIAKNARSLNTFVQHVAELKGDAEGLGNRALPLWNSIANHAESASGDPRVTKFNAAKTAVVSEFASLLKGTGATDQEIKSVEESINSSMSPNQLDASIRQMLKLANGRLQALDAQWQQGMGKPRDFAILTNQSKTLLKGLGYGDLLEDNPADAPSPSPSASGASASGTATHRYNPATGAIEAVNGR